MEDEEGTLSRGREGGEPSVRYHSRRARILTLYQDLRAKGHSQVDSFYGALNPGHAVETTKVSITKKDSVEKQKSCLDDSSRSAS